MSGLNDNVVWVTPGGGARVSSSDPDTHLTLGDYYPVEWSNGTATALAYMQFNFSSFAVRPFAFVSVA